MGRELAATVIERHRRRLGGRARRITIDLDVTDDPTHGAQQLTFFHGHYDTWCYLPLLAFLTFDDEADQYLCAALLRPGNAAATTGAHDLLKRLIVVVREAFPGVRVRVRLDGGFAHPTLLANLDTWRVEYVVAMAENAVLARHAEPLMVDVRAQVAATEATAHVYGETQYAAGSWTQARRIIIRAEVVHLAGRDPRDNARFVITNLRQTPQWIYEHVYCGRGEIENRIKELHHGLEIDRTSSKDAKQFSSSAIGVHRQPAITSRCKRKLDRSEPLGNRVGRLPRSIALQESPGRRRSSALPIKRFHQQLRGHVPA